MLKPLDNRGWDDLACAHLMSRAGFGVTREELGRWRALGREGAVKRLITGSPKTLPDPPSASEIDLSLMEKRDSIRTRSGEERQKAQREIRRAGQQALTGLRLWWLEQMFSTDAPLQEKMTLFWHDHFATSVTKVRNANYMWLQNNLFRKLGRGNFRELVVEVGRDPSMLVWLDGARSNRRAPNENYARELMELFTLGEGHYSEEDIQESARAHTGWVIDRSTTLAYFDAGRHDDGQKTFFGETGSFDDADIVGLIVKNPQCSRYICWKLWDYFAFEQPSDALVEALAKRFREADYEIAPVLETMFLSEEFYSDRARRRQVKSPVQWVISTFKTLEAPRFPSRLAYGMARSMGQDLLAPPSVKGWDDGRAWISTATLLLRNNLAKLLVYGGASGELRQIAGGNMARNAKGDQTALNEAREREREDGIRERNRLPALAWPDRILTSEDRRDPHALVAAITRKFYLTAPQKRHYEVFEDYVNRDGRGLSADDIRGAIYLAMTNPEFQLT